ncbi:S8 family serine peptidase [Microbacterium sp. 2FI]|uniref:S8 family peptidase n=1 Tax=Microbacterium sp. 2FI TaxID=2502193 RepID=UPI0014858BF8|nr:S8 family serine peptidase [Microbacterium sp. 2FI]
MKHHLILKLRERIPEPPAIPDWITFIGDKSASVSRINDEVDPVLRRARTTFWVTHEYIPATERWSPEEVLHGLDRTYRVIFDDLAPLTPTLLAELAGLRSVERCSQLVVASVDLPEAPRVAPFGATGSTREQIGLDYANALTRGRPDVRIAVLDTGVDVDHPELQGTVVAASDFVNLVGLDTSAFVGDMLDADADPEDEVGHGTHVAGIIAGAGRSMDAGTAPDCKIMAVRVLATMRTASGLQGAGIVDNINPALKWCVDNGADVVNMSVGIRHTGGGLPHADVVRYAQSRGVSVVAASGNDGAATKYYPGALPGVIAVGACDEEGRVASFSSYGADITVVAPGVRILSSYAHGRYAVASGTSQASPQVAGAVALMKSYARDHGFTLDGDDVMRVLRETSDRIDSRSRSPHAGYGVINLTDAFKWLSRAAGSRRAGSRTR